MDRILILMTAEDFLDAQTALYSAKENASDATLLSYGLMLENEPDEESQALMAALGRVQFLSSISNASCTWGAYAFTAPSAIKPAVLSMFKLMLFIFLLFICFVVKGS